MSNLLNRQGRSDDAFKVFNSFSEFVKTISNEIKLPENLVG